MLIRYAVYIITLSIIIFTPILVNNTQLINNDIIKRNSINVKLVKDEKPKKAQIQQTKKIKKKKTKIKPKKQKVIEKKEIIEPIKEQDIEQEAIQEVKNIQNKHIETIKERYFNSIYDSISRYKKYPKKAKRFRQEGDVKVSFFVDENGLISNFKIIQNSEYSNLNKAVVKIFNKLKYFDKPPTELDLPLEISITISYKIK